MRTLNPIHMLAAAMLMVVAVGVHTTARAERTAAESTLPAYDTLDVDKDGIVTLPEIEVHGKALAERIRHCDTNADLKLSRKEYAVCKPGAMVKHAVASGK